MSQTLGRQLHDTRAVIDLLRRDFDTQRHAHARQARRSPRGPDDADAPYASITRPLGRRSPRVEYANEQTHRAMHFDPSQGLSCNEKRATTDPTILSKDLSAGQRPHSSTQSATQRSSSQDYLDKGKLDHVIPQFYDVISSKSSLRGLFMNHFESLDNLKHLVRQNQLNTVACKLMKMIVEQNSMSGKQGKRKLTTESPIYDRKNYQTESRNIFQVTPASATRPIDEQKASTLKPQASKQTPVYSNQPKLEVFAMQTGGPKPALSKTGKEKGGTGQTGAVQYRTEKYGGVYQGTHQPTGPGSPYQNQMPRPDQYSGTKNETVTFEVSHQPLDLTYSRSEIAASPGTGLPLTKDLVSKECSNLSLTLGQGSLHDSRLKTGFDKGDEMSEPFLHKKADLTNPTSNLKKITGRGGGRKSQSNDASLGSQDAGGKATGSRPGVEAGPELGSRRSAGQSGKAGSGGRSRDGSNHSQTERRHESQGKGRGLDARAEPGDRPAGSARLGKNAEVTFGKRDGLAQAMGVTNAHSHVQAPGGYKSLASSARGEHSLRNLQTDYSGSQRDLIAGQSGLSNAFGMDEIAGQETSSKITPQAIYEKLGRTPELNFRKRSSPVKAFEAKAEIKYIGKAIGYPAEQEYLNLQQLGEGSFMKGKSHKYAKAGYKGLGTPTDRPTAVSSGGDNLGDSLGPRTQSSQSRRGNPPPGSHRSQIEAGSSYLNSFAQADRQRLSRADVNQNLFQFGGAAYSQKNSRQPITDARYQKSGSLLSSRDSPGKTLSQGLIEESSPLTTRQMIKSLLRDELSKVALR